MGTRRTRRKSELRPVGFREPLVYATSRIIPHSQREREDVQQRLYDEALTEFRKAERDRHDDPILIFSSDMLAAAQNRRAEAFEVVKLLEQMSGAFDPEFTLSCLRQNGLVSQGSVVTPLPLTLEHPLALGPFEHFHQFAVASIVARDPMLSMPILPVNALKCT